MVLAKCLRKSSDWSTLGHISILNQLPGPEGSSVLTGQACVMCPLLGLGEDIAPFKPLRVGKGVSQRKFQVVFPEEGNLDAK